MIVKVERKAYFAGGDCYPAAFSPTLVMTASSRAAHLWSGSERSATSLLMALISYHVLDFVLCLFFGCSSSRRQSFLWKWGLAGEGEGTLQRFLKCLDPVSLGHPVHFFPPCTFSFSGWVRGRKIAKLPGQALVCRGQLTNKPCLRTAQHGDWCVFFIIPETSTSLR